MIERLEFETKSLKGFPVAGPTKRKLPVYLPPQYDPQRASGYPVALILSGWGSRSASYLADDSAFGISLEERFDRAILDGKIPPCIIAFPDGTTRFGGSQYLNSPALGYYSDYLCDEIVELIDSKFNTDARPERRALLGHSSGGFGAIINGVLRPDRFSFICSSAGDSYFEVSLLPMIRFVVEEIEKSRGIENFLKEYLEHPNPKSLSRTKGEAMMLLSLAPCYAPNIANAPLFGDLFFDLHSGEIIPEIWEKYLSWDPIHFIPRHSEAAQKLKFILLDAGKSDEYGLQLGHRQIAKQLMNLKIPHEISEFPGGHGGQSWRFENRLEILFKKMFQ